MIATIKHTHPSFVSWGTFVSRVWGLILSLMLTFSLSTTSSAQNNPLFDSDQGQGPFSYANVGDVHVTHIALDLTTNFETTTLTGIALLRLKWLNPFSKTIFLDSEGLEISKVEGIGQNGWVPLNYTLANGDDVLGQKLTISADNSFRALRIFYKTSPEAKGLDWYSSGSAAKRRTPFLTSLWGPTNTRSWIPLQDTPAVKTTFEARIHTNQNLTVLMSAQQDPDTRLDGDYYFYMREDISPHQISLIVGQFAYKKLNEFLGVYAPPKDLNRVVTALGELPKINQTAINLFGFKPFKRLDFVLAPKSFPLNQQTTPRLALLSPNIIHQSGEIDPIIFDVIATSFLGNIVGNNAWADAWLAKGISSYASNLLLNATGKEKLASHLRARKFFELDQLLIDDTIALPNLYEHGIFPNPQAGLDEGTTLKTFFFFTMIEDIIKKETQTMFLKTWLKDNQGQNKTTAEFQRFLGLNLQYLFPKALNDNLIDTWLYQDGLPPSVIEPNDGDFMSVESDALEWLSDNMTVNNLPAKEWSIYQWFQFLETISDDVKDSQMDGLNKKWRLSTNKNQALQSYWFQLVLKTRYEPGYKALENFLENQAQEILILPLYEQMSDNRSRLTLAREVYERASGRYHKSTQKKLDIILKISN
jgi:hypothetical protein